MVAMAINVKVLERPQLSFWEKLYLPQVLRGLMITLRHITHFRPITVQYPEEVKAPSRELPGTSRFACR